MTGVKHIILKFGDVLERVVFFLKIFTVFVHNVISQNYFFNYIINFTVIQQFRSYIYPEKLNPQIITKSIEIRLSLRYNCFAFCITAYG